MSKKIKVITNLIFNYSNTVLSGLSNFVLIPIYLSSFGETNWGIWLTILGIINIVSLNVYSLAYICKQFQIASFKTSAFLEIVQIITRTKRFKRNQYLK